MENNNKLAYNPNNKLIHMIFKKYLLFIFTIFLLSGCSVTSVGEVYSNGDFDITVPSGWVVEKDSSVLPEDVILVLLYKDLDNNIVYTINVIKESYSSEEISFIDRSKGMVIGSEGYLLINEKEIEDGDKIKLFHHFYLVSGKEQKKIMQLYAYDDVNKTGYVVTGILPNIQENVANEAVVENILNSFVLTGSFAK